MNKQQLAAKIWESANKMRSKIEANEYKDYILGFIFYKFLSEKQEGFLLKNQWSRKDFKEITEDNAEVVKYLQEENGYFISYDNLFSTWISKGVDFDVSNVRDALSAFVRLISPSYKKVFDKIFDTLQSGLSKLGDTTGSQTKAISELLYLIKDIPMDSKQDYDVLGFIYEYLIEKFAANAGKKAGEFYTPHEVSLLMSEIVAYHLKDKEKIDIYDPTSGSGSLLINIGRSVSKHINNKNNIKYYAQELKENTYNLTRMNLIMRGILPDNIVTRRGDTLEQDWPFFDESDPSNTYNPLYVDAVVSNPPYSQPWDPTNKEVDARYSRFGLAPKSKADYAFLLHDLYHIKPDGIVAIVLPHGVLFRGGEEEKIRRNLIEQNHIDAIIGLPANIFFGTGIPTIIMILKQRRPNTDVLIVDASKGFVKVGKNNKLQASDIKKIVDTFIKREDVEKYARVVSREEITENDYNLNIPRYVDSSEPAESWDIYASIFGGIPNEEVDLLKEFWAEFKSLRSDLFDSIDENYVSLKSKDISDLINNNSDVISFKEKFANKFEDFSNYLKGRLIDNATSLNIAKEENTLSKDIFDRLNFTTIIDKYKAYQLLNDKWTEISIDLEMIQTEGVETVKKVDPNMVIKKRNGKDEEVQDGWKGRILPFELVQEMLLSDALDSINQKEQRVLSIQSEFNEIIEEFDEEEKLELVDDSADENDDEAVEIKISNKIISSKAKEFSKNKIEYDNASLEFRVIKLNELLSEERLLKSEIRKENAELHEKTKETIEGLSDSQALKLLENKWITPLVKSINELPNSVLNKLTKSIKELSEKYETTYLEVEEQITESENTLSKLLEELVGDEYDMKGLEQFIALLNGENHDK